MNDLIQLVIFAFISSALFTLINKKKSKTPFIQNFILTALIFIVCDWLLHYFHIRFSSDRSGSLMLVVVILLTIFILVQLIRKR